MMTKADYTKIISRYFGDDIGIDGIRSVSGGDINEARLITLSDGRNVFLKENIRSKGGSFEAEQRGLAAIKQTDSVRVPEVIGAGVAGLLGTLWQRACQDAYGGDRRMDARRQVWICRG